MSELLPVVTPVNEAYWHGIARRELWFQRCRACGNAWLPAREDCPRCLASDPSWEQASGRGTLVSWVVYHRALHPEFEAKLPYTVGVVELEEGPRMIAGISSIEDNLGIDQPVEVDYTPFESILIPSFRPAESGPTTDNSEGEVA